MSKFWKRLYMFLLLAFLYAPIVVLIVYSFNAGKARGSWDGFSLVWYQVLLEDREVLLAVIAKSTSD